jgi:hypothetical protein
MIINYSIAFNTTSTLGAAGGGARGRWGPRGARLFLSGEEYLR